MHRPLTASERALLDRFREADIPAKEQLAQQIASAEVVGESPGFLDLAVPQSMARIASPAGLPLHGWYQDTDGTLVSLLLNVPFPEGRIDSLERYRVDGEPIVNYAPDPALVRIGRDPFDGPHQSATFDPKSGWRRTT
jgi:hypothetical protein